MEDDILRYVKNGMNSYEVIQVLVSIDSISSFKLRLNQPNKLLQELLCISHCIVS